MTILKFFRFFNGFVRVKVTGTYPERIINICYKNSLTVWGIKKKNGELFFNILSKDFKALKALRNKSGVKIKIKYKIGLPFAIKKHKKRVGLLIGTVVFFGVLYFLSGFVWNIKVYGNNAVSTAEIMQVANEMGICEGMLKSKINSPEMRNTMLYKFNKLSWVSFNLEGSLLTINVSETKPQEQENNKTPTNLVAAKDGVIKYLEIKNGYAAVKVGQAVKKGELLVSGAAEFKEGVASFFNSNGKVLAETEIVYTETIALKQNVMLPNGKVTTKKVLQFFGLNIPLYLGSVKGEYSKNVKEYYIKTENNYLPIKIIDAEFLSLENTEIILTETEAQAKLKASADAWLKQSNVIEIVDIKDDIILQNGEIKIIRKAKVIEDIAIEKPINISSLS